MRTTVRLDPDLMAAAKKLALSTNRTLTAVIEDALREVIARREAAKAQRPTYTITTFGGGGLMPGVDIDSNVALLDLMDEDDDTRRR